MGSPDIKNIWYFSAEIGLLKNLITVYSTRTGIDEPHCLPLFPMLVFSTGSDKGF